MVSLALCCTCSRASTVVLAGQPCQSLCRSQGQLSQGVMVGASMTEPSFEWLRVRAQAISLMHAQTGEELRSVTLEPMEVYAYKVAFTKV